MSLRRLPRRQRRTLHRKYAEHIEKRHEGRLERIYSQLVYHYSQADIGEKTVEFALRLPGLHSMPLARRSNCAVKTALEFLDDEWKANHGAKATHT
jgi:predicted ATPase